MAWGNGYKVESREEFEERINQSKNSENSVPPDGEVKKLIIEAE